MSQRLDELIIRTPEGVTFSLPLAGVALRGLAALIDLLLVLAINSLVVRVLAGFKVVSQDTANAALMLCGAILLIGYGMFFEWVWEGQTIGKRLLKIRVVDQDGLRLSLSQIIVRNLLRLLDSIPVIYVVGGLACLISRRSQRLGDFVANTVVVRLRKLEEPNVDEILGERHNSFRAFPHLEARLKQLLSREEHAMFLEAVKRRDGFNAPDRVVLFRELRGFVEELVHFPEEITRDLSDEQFLRNVVGSLYRKREG